MLQQIWLNNATANIFFRAKHAAILQIWQNMLEQIFFFFRVTMVIIAIIFHNHILILTLWASLLRF